ncbi:type VII secretion protein EssC [Bifidobacterium sp. ESL0775]|uniref:type VII secretion protein EssC n=1 Tax=Bifidobacterium sp. ESL0775 TaxID=2983230 RepID=UPI0023F68812|nr:type VII secretion protein EssC [Bifidobacterium sp. ESL0775]WEV69756.1 type VII secretion protein EssC [Bifidobacterium sp. ESL0775]
MLLTVLEGDEIQTMTLSDRPSGVLWVTVPSSNANASREVVAKVEAHAGNWVMNPAPGRTMRDGQGRVVKQAVLSVTGSSAFTMREKGSTISIIVRQADEGAKVFRIMGFSADVEVTIGRSASNTFRYDSPYVSSKHAGIAFAGGCFTLTDFDSMNGTYVNGKKMPPRTPTVLNAGDVVEILGLIITVGHRFLSYNSPLNLTLRSNGALARYWEPAKTAMQQTADESGLQVEDEYFYPAPRFKRGIVPFKLSVDAPPAPQRPDETSVAMKIGPSMVMVLGALVSGAVMVTQMQRSSGSMLNAIPMLVMAVTMLVGSVIWPILSRRLENRKIAGDEKVRSLRYAEYLDHVRVRLVNETSRQKEILCENRISASDCVKRVLSHDSRVMDRTSAHDDFLELRLGIGTLPLAAEIRYPDRHFSIEKDELAEVVHRLSDEPRDIVDVPISVSLADNPVVGLCGADKKAKGLLSDLIVQIAALHSYEDVKLVLVCDEVERESWAWVEALPHIFSNDRGMRYFATSEEDLEELSVDLGKEARQRRDEAKGNGTTPLPYYVVVCTSRVLMGKSTFLGDLMSDPVPGFTVLCQTAERKNLPRQCSAIVELSDEKGVIWQLADELGEGTSFAPDAVVDDATCIRFSHALARIHLALRQSHEALPDSLGFMSMYKAGNVEQLNIRSRWRRARGSETLAARVGVDEQGEPFYLNLHEKFHGPHGLIAGTTGSGKSEFIITWILSMCVEYSPDQVAFVLIDYKGGGLAGAFENNRYRLPHLAGTITNLDKAAVTRGMVSIQSELKRRQELFNKAREIADGDNVDIYDYLRMYREGKVNEPCPHLFIVADEFAELKQQEPEFLDELVSAARIGRSLGVHLILATQKPSGVVNDQIWSNSRFKVSLKVSDVADSKEMIGRPDAAALTQAGRFYLLVGYNELFALGQAAYSGAPYRPVEQYEEPVDDAVVLLNDVGHQISSARPAISGSANATKTPELVAVLGHICEVAKAEGLRARQLWLDPLPGLIKVEDIERMRYQTDEKPASAEVSAVPMPGSGSASNQFLLDPIVGMLDDPARQDQRVLTQPLTAGGNLLLLGGSDSGVESVLLAMLFDLVSTHSASQCNIYALDFGSETLGALRSAPQVGDVVVGGNDEKVFRLFDLLDSLVASRRRKLASFGGSFERYTRGHSDMPAVVFVINGLATFTEMYEQKLLDRLIRLSRDGNRVGLSLILVAGSPNEVRGRLRSNFKNRLVFTLDNPDEYLDALGSMRGVAVPTGFAQGVVRVDDETYMFQGAQVLGHEDDEFGYVERRCRQIGADVKSKASGVPTMPNHIEASYLAGRDSGGVEFPFGVYQSDLSLAGFNFKERPIERIVSNRNADIVAFVKAVLRFFAGKPNTRLALLDVAKRFDTLPGCCDYETQQDKEALDYLCGLADGTDSFNGRTVAFVSGISGLLVRAMPDESQKVEDFLHGLDGRSLAMVLFDTTNDASYGSESWFTAHSSASNGIWIGTGLDGQSRVQHVYGVGEPIDPKIKAPWGYIVLDGGLRKVNLLVQSDDNAKNERDDS